MWCVITFARSGLEDSDRQRVAAVRADAAGRLGVHGLSLGEAQPLPTGDQLGGLDWTVPLDRHALHYHPGGTATIPSAAGHTVRIDDRLARLLGLGEAWQTTNPLGPIQVRDDAGPVAYLAVYRLRVVS